MSTYRLNMKNKFESDIFIDVLEKENIPFAVIQNESLAYNGIFEMTMGWGYVEVPLAYQERADKILKELLESFDQNIQ